MYIPGAILERYVCQPFTDPNLEFLDQVCMLVMNQNQQYTGKNIERLYIKKPQVGIIVNKIKFKHHIP